MLNPHDALPDVRSDVWSRLWTHFFWTPKTSEKGNSSSWHSFRNTGLRDSERHHRG